MLFYIAVGSSGDETNLIVLIMYSIVTKWMQYSIDQ
jgi:hypothetical protein